MIQELKERFKDRITSQHINSCPRCSGSKYIVVSKHTEAEQETYGDERTAEYAQPCPECNAGLNDRAKYNARLSNIPKRYMSKYIDSFDWDLYGCDISMQRSIVDAFVRDFKKVWDYGKGLYIHSSTRGTGKTMISCVIANEAMYRYGLRVKFVYVSGLLDEIERSRKEGSSNNPLEVLYNTDLLILDDIGAKKGNDFLNDVLFKICDRRIDASKLTIFTSNYALTELDTKAKIDGRIIDRIFGTTVDLPLPEVAIRAQKANEGNTEFFKRMGIQLS